MLSPIKRSLHTSRVLQNSIMMPAMSPLMTEGAITRWFKKEGEAFKAGEAILEIESDIYRISVEAENPGIMGRILVPAGTQRVPVEQILALVAKDPAANMNMQSRSSESVPTPPRYPQPMPRQHLSSHLRPRSHTRTQSQPSSRTASPTRTTPTRSQTMPQPSTFRSNSNPPRPRSPTHPPVHLLNNATSPTANKHFRDMHSSSRYGAYPGVVPEQIKEVQGAAADVRRTIVSSLLSTGANTRGDYFDALL
ncbi:hypothetical protein ONZ45_g787 [Pleurotus djamor]|nr:hypothetical protein ONZ45_g787 [Pleurotus djamor]